MVEAPSVAVIGPGAIGTTIAALLHERHIAVTIAGRSPRGSLQLDTDRGAVTVPGPVLTDPTRSTAAADVVFLAVKATQTAAAEPWLTALCEPSTVVCVLQNGIEQIETVAPLVPRSTVVPAIVWFPAERRPDGMVRLRGTPRLTVPRTDGADRIRDLLQHTGCALEIAEDFRTLAWQKLLQNAVAGLMALTGRRAGMFHRGDVGGVALAYLRECLAVARADGADLADDEPERLLEKFRAFPSDMGTSMLSDREDGRPLEWEARNGVIGRLGRRYGIPTPVGDVVVPLLAAASDGPG
ncbi:oxidoreductase [Curtobacterium sp. YC1]|nr:oxidoreductase [Curtobacterium sp. YC1]